ncbi:protein-L-isoaspartate(D-aspartate) O-methyltransferase [Candidatus Fermentibacterales bacterium]|nr:protein-L-isoaspartate(D-aspartate) O-methyltransferase [Candidatus Fermentibacterales bacterium]
MKDDLVRPRQEMVERLARDYPGSDPAVLQAMLVVPRHHFVADALRHQAYLEASLPIGMGQTLSQPSTVLAALSMLSLRAGDVLLEIGSGSGYLAAVASRLCRRVYGMERLMQLVNGSRSALTSLGILNVSIGLGDGSAGWPEHAPYDCIVISAAAPGIPPGLADQLSSRGRIVAPLGNRTDQLLELWRLEQGRLVRSGESIGCRFVPLIGKGGWSG